MPSIEIKPAIKIRIEEILDGISHLDTPDLEEFLQEVAHLLAKRRTKTLSARESELLLKLNEAVLSDEDQQTYDLLYGQLQAENITDLNHQHLLKLIQKREEKGVEKMASLVELAQLKKYH